MAHAAGCRDPLGAGAQLNLLLVLAGLGLAQAGAPSGPSTPATPQRARYQELVAVWAAAHGNAADAATAARTALFHDPLAAAPRLLLVSLPAPAAPTPDERLRLLEEATRVHGAPASAWTALGNARAALGSPEAGAAFAEAELRGAGSENYAEWLSVAAVNDRAAITARWLALADPGRGGRALRATLAVPGDAVGAASLCQDALGAVLLGEAIAPGVVATRCGPVGRADDARRALAVVNSGGTDTTAAEALLTAWPPGS